METNWSANIYTSTGPYGEPLFAVPTENNLDFDHSISGKLINQLEAVANMVKIGSNINSGIHRQIFFVQLGGFDNHASQATNHGSNLRELSLALWKFQKGLEEHNLDQYVSTFTMTDFGRTVSNNEDGTDHGWGAHQIVMSGDPAFQGGQLLGALPDLTLGGNNDFSSKGRLIPTIAIDQMNASLISWLGVDTTLMPTIFPNLSNFQSGGTIDTA